MLESDITAGITKLVPGDHPIDDTHKTVAANMILPVYSEYKPEKVSEDFSGNGTDLYDIFVTGMASWSDGFSSISTIEYPVDDTELPVVLDSDLYMIQFFPAGDKLRFINDTPAATEHFRVISTAMKTFATVDTVDENSVICLASGFFADMLATWYAQAGDSTIRADSAESKSLSDQYASRAKILKGCYWEHIGKKPGSGKSAVYGSVDWDLSGPYGDRLTNSNYLR